MAVVYKINGKSVTAEEFAAHKSKIIEVDGKFRGSRRMTRVYSSKGGGQRSRSMGCHRKDVSKLRSEIERRGISGVSYEPGRHGYDCVITSERGANEWMKAYGEICGLGPLHNAGSEGVE
jgi:hypothetical protein